MLGRWASIDMVCHITSRASFRQTGSEQLHSVYDSKKWIGACEAAALFRSMSIRARVIDFISEKNDVSTMMDWMWNYFSEKEGRPPLYLQHEGHSRTCVGAIRQV